MPRVAVCLALCATATAVVHRVPLLKNEEHEVKASWSLHQPLGASEPIVIKDYSNSQYYGQISVGTPGQVMDVIYGELVFPSSRANFISLFPARSC